MTENKSVGWEACGRCRELYPKNELDQHVWSIRHTYKGRKDNPTVSSSVTFHKVKDNSPANLCLKCQKKTIDEMANGGNWAGGAHI